jgi:hypothetical protein
MIVSEKKIMKVMWCFFGCEVVSDTLSMLVKTITAVMNDVPCLSKVRIGSGAVRLVGNTEKDVDTHINVTLCMLL